MCVRRSLTIPLCQTSHITDRTLHNEFRPIFGALFSELRTTRHRRIEWRRNMMGSSRRRERWVGCVFVANVTGHGTMRLMWPKLLFQFVGDNHIVQRVAGADAAYVTFSGEAGLNDQHSCVWKDERLEEI